MPYLEMWLLGDGALSEKWAYEDPENPDKIVADLVNELETDFPAAGVNEECVVELYTMRHDHDMDQEECACVQYLADHKPVWANRKEDGE